METLTWTDLVCWHSDYMEELDAGRREKTNGRHSNGSARSCASRNGSSARRDSWVETDGEFGNVLTYEWHAKMYLGAAHGVAGILYVLMQGEFEKEDGRMRPGHGFQACVSACRW